MKSFIQKIFSKPWIAIAALLLAVAPNVSHAAWFGLAEFGYSAVAKIMWALTTLVGMVAGFFVAIEAYAVEWILHFNLEIATQPLVAQGFPVILSLTNLVLVLGIIIIAIATILRLESYGIKTLLWKVLVVAVAVNFGLVVAGTILSFSDNVTLFMLKAINPAENSDGISGFATNLTAAFNPQRMMAFSDKQLSEEDANVLASALGATASDMGAMLVPILGSLLSVFAFGMILIIMGALVVILVMRYVGLSFLLVTLPIAWAAWAFPAYKKRATDWWGKFIKLAFAPIPIVFFIWLGLITAQVIGNSEFQVTTVNTSGVAGAVAGFLGNLLSPLLFNLMNIVLISGIMGMGLVAAEKMGASFAKNAQNGIKSLEGGMKKELTKRIQRGGSRIGAATREKLAPATGRLAKFGAVAGLKVKSAAQYPIGKKVHGVRAESVMLDEHGKPMMSEVGVNAQGEKGVWSQVAVDGKGNIYKDYTRNASGVLVDKKTGKEISDGEEKSGFVTRDGKVFTDATSRSFEYATKEGTILKDSDLALERNGKIAVRDDGAILANMMEANGQLKANYVNKGGGAVSAMEAGYLRTQEEIRKESQRSYGDAAAEAKKEATKAREKLWAAAEADKNILYALSVAPFLAAVKATKEPAQKAPKKKDVLEAMEKMGLHFEHEEHHEDHGGGGAHPGGGDHGGDHGGGGAHPGGGDHGSSAPEFKFPGYGDGRDKGSRSVNIPAH